MATGDDVTRYSEEQAFPIWAYGIFAVAGTLSLAGGLAAAPRLPMLLLPPVVLAAAGNLLYLKTRVTAREIIVTFGAVFPLYRRRIPLSDIASAEAVTYSPLGEYGGWGIRGWGRNVALNARGNRGVRLTLRDGRRVLIGSQEPERLRTALEDGKESRP